MTGFKLTKKVVKPWHYISRAQSMGEMDRGAPS